MFMTFVIGILVLCLVMALIQEILRAPLVYAILVGLALYLTSLASGG